MHFRFSPRDLALAFALTTLATAAGCGDRPLVEVAPAFPEVPAASGNRAADSAAPVADGVNTESERAATTAAAEDATVTLSQREWPQIEEMVAAQRGKVVVVDLWATYCVPCRTEFPGLVALSREDPESIVCISVSLDEPSHVDDVLAFLHEHRAAMQNVLCTTKTDKLYDEILHLGSIPAVYVYGRDGTQAKVFTGPTPAGEEFTYAAHIAPFVKSLASGH